MEGNVQQPQKDTDNPQPDQSRCNDDADTDKCNVVASVRVCNPLTAATLSPVPVPSQVTRRKSKHSKMRQPGAMNRFKKSHDRKTKLYQDWLIWKVSPPWSFINLNIAFDRARDRWLELYPGEPVIYSYTFRGLCVAYHVACQSPDSTFSTSDFQQAAMTVRFVATRNKAMYKYDTILQQLVRYNYINPLGQRGRYALTTRSREFIKLFTAKYAELIGELIPPKK